MNAIDRFPRLPGTHALPELRRPPIRTAGLRELRVGGAFRVTSENLESIHNQSVPAEFEGVGGALTH